MSFPAADILIAYSFLVQEYSIKDMHLLHVVTAVISCLCHTAYFIYSHSQFKKHDYKPKNPNERSDISDTSTAIIT